jgi:hypothetical protein
VAGGAGRGRYFDREESARLKMSASVCKTSHLSVLRKEVPDRIEYEENQSEATCDPGRCNIADRHIDAVTAIFSLKLFQHRGGQFDAGYGDAAISQRQRNTARTHRKFERRTVPGKLRQTVDRRAKDLRSELV